MKAPAATKDKGPNATTIEILQKMASYYENTGDHWRLYSYRRAIASLRSHPKKVTTKAEARALPCIGDSLAEKIEEIRFTNRLQKLENISDAPTDKAIELFMGVYGAGYKQASTWVAQGHRTLEDLSNFSKLTKNQRVGVERYKDFNSRIPREEVDDHAKFVRGHMAHISPALSLTIGGSYRRGKQTCGDIDFLITGKNLFPETLRNLVLRDLVGRLTAFSYIQCSLSVSSSSDGRIWHGAASLPQHFPRIWRRVDFLVVPEEEWGAALIYFTGDDIFNRSVRLLASRMGYRLNQQGLFKDVMRGPQRVKVTEGTLVEARSEKKIFEVLGVPWRAPEDRNFG